jgi:hypothetical protein
LVDGSFEWNAEMVLRRLKPSRLLPAVVFTSGLLSAFFVNDIVCLVMVPFVLSITRRLRLEPLPYLLAVATASNIGSVASITGNPQNMLIEHRQQRSVKTQDIEDSARFRMQARLRPRHHFAELLQCPESSRPAPRTRPTGRP